MFSAHELAQAQAQYYGPLYVPPFEKLLRSHGTSFPRRFHWGRMIRLAGLSEDHAWAVLCTGKGGVMGVFSG